MMIHNGIDTLIQGVYAPIRGRRIGLFTNASATTGDLIRTFDVFRAAHGHYFHLEAIFTPEHGLTAAVADGEAVASEVDTWTGAPIHSLYGASYAPTPAMLAGLEAIVCDIQDIGVRYYTYLWTITYIVEAAGVAGIPVLILDRPNPLGARIDGAILQPGYESFVGRFPIPVQHGMTLGEIVGMFNSLWNPTPARLEVLQCRDNPTGAIRVGHSWEDTGLVFVPTSPAMPHLSTVRQYPGACLVEGTIFSEGRGTALPFEITGAPFVDARSLAKRLNALELAGVRYRPHSFQPTASKFAGVVCHGVQAHRISAEYRPLLAWVAVIRTLRQMYPDQFGWKTETFDRLYGSAAGRAFIESDAPLAEIAEVWARDVALFAETCAPYRIYGD